jgi:putative ABC transport system permease protein
MISTYLKLAWRNLWKQRAFTALNIFGLTVAFTAAILLGLAALFELSTNQFHANKAKLYRLYYSSQTDKGIDLRTSHAVPFTPALKTEVQGVQYASRFIGGGFPMRYGDKDLDLTVKWVDEDFLKMFTFPVLTGSQAPINGLNQIAITQIAAKRIFGEDDPLGKIIHINIEDEDKPFTVSAVLQDVPKTSNIEFEALTRFENHTYAKQRGDQWNSSTHDVYIQLANNVSVEQFEKNTVAFTNLHYKGGIEERRQSGVKPDANGQYMQLKALPFLDDPFTRFSDSTMTTTRQFPYMILTLSLLILFIACINFINMSIGLSVGRLREIGMRKSLGADKARLFAQFWSESLLVFGASAVMGFGLAKMLLPEFQRLFRTRATFDLLNETPILLGFAGAFLLITVVAGGYPPALMSRVGTLQSLKGKLENVGNNWLRNSLIVVQFGISILLISSTLVIWSQLNYMINQPTGFNKEQIIAFPIGDQLKDDVAVQRLRNELQNQTNVVSVSASDNILGRGKDGSGYSSQISFQYKGHGVKTNMLNVDYDYVETLELSMVAGRAFSRDHSIDSIGLVINETMAAELGGGDLIGTMLPIGDSVPNRPIIGIVKDYHFQSFRRKIEPLTMTLDPSWGYNVAYVKVTPQNLPQAMSVVENAWKKVDPVTLFEGSYLDENIERLYQREKTLSSLITWGAGIAITISCLGLFAIALLMVAKRRKEIGIRKVVGASIVSLTLLLSKDFLKLVGIAFVVATPVAYWLMGKWLQDYVYRIPLHWWIFALAGILATLIALITVSFQTTKAALVNPVKSLRSE